MKLFVLMSLLVFSSLAFADACDESWADAEAEFAKAKEYLDLSNQQLQNAPNIKEELPFCVNFKDAMSNMLSSSHYFETSANYWGDASVYCHTDSRGETAWNNFEISLDNKYITLRAYKQIADLYYQSRCVVYNL